MVHEMNRWTLVYEMNEMKVTSKYVTTSNMFSNKV